MFIRESQITWNNTEWTEPEGNKKRTMMKDTGVTKLDTPRRTSGAQLEGICTHWHISCTSLKSTRCEQRLVWPGTSLTGSNHIRADVTRIPKSTTSRDRTSTGRCTGATGSIGRRAACGSCSTGFGRGGLRNQRGEMNQSRFSTGRGNHVRILFHIGLQKQLWQTTHVGTRTATRPGSTSIFCRTTGAAQIWRTAKSQHSHSIGVPVITNRYQLSKCALLLFILHRNNKVKSE